MIKLNCVMLSNMRADGYLVRNTLTGCLKTQTSSTIG
jgi:hypothetical protein